MSIAERLEQMADITAENWRQSIRICISESRDGYGNINAALLEKLLHQIMGEGE